MPFFLVLLEILSINLTLQAISWAASDLWSQSVEQHSLLPKWPRERCQNMEIQIGYYNPKCPDLRAHQRVWHGPKGSQDVQSGQLRYPG